MRRLLLLVLFLLPCLLFAHPANVPSAQIKVAPDGTFSARIRFDAIAYATGTTPKDADDMAMNALVDGPTDALRASLADAAGRFRRGFGAIPGGEIDRLDFPTAGSVRRFLAGNPTPRLPVMLTALVWGHVPKGSRTIAFRYPETFDTIIQTVEFPYQEPISEPVDPGHVSATLRIPTSEEIAKVAAAFSKPRDVTRETPKRPTSALIVPSVEVPSGAGGTSKEPAAPTPKSSLAVPVPPTRVDKARTLPERTESLVPESPAAAVLAPAPPMASSAPPPPPHVTSLLSNVATYLRMGFTHILPQGIDHILFVLGLFLLGSSTKALVKQITAFTVAHSITLALTALGVIHFPSRIIEPVIAISIAFVAIENVFTREVRPWRTAVVFLFGLVHGMGFAEVFAEAGLRGAGLLTALVSFNVGVELGQLTVVALAFGVVGWFRSDARYRRVVVVPASMLIALIALFWTAQRIVR